MSCAMVCGRNITARNFIQTVVEDVQKTQERIRPYIRKTALDFSIWLSEEATKTSVYLKLESEQITGSFKARGAFNKICIIKEDNEMIGKNLSVTTASSGNHGQACALAMRTLGIEGKIFVPECTTEDKITAIKKFGGVLEIFGDDCVKAEARAKKYAKEMEDSVYISPYNDTDVVHGQGTIGLEVLEDLPDVDTIFVSVGGGGLISGIATYVKAIRPSVKIIGCQPEKSCVMYESFKAQAILDLESYPTLSDGTAGGVDQDALVEGAAAVCIAAYIKEKSSHRGEKIVLVMCGSNVGVETVKNVIDANITD